MVKQIIGRIIDNFQQQLHLYHAMFDLSSAQLTCLQSRKAMSGELQEILASRQALMEKISLLNETNRSLQQQAVKDLEIEEFVLKHLKLCIDEDSFNVLQDAVMELAKVLESINDTDRKNQLLMTDIHTAGVPKADTSHKQAGEAYRKSMQSGKEFS